MSDLYNNFPSQTKISETTKFNYQRKWRYTHFFRKRKYKTLIFLVKDMLSYI